jgi:hypothetical protein
MKISLQIRLFLAIAFMGVSQILFAQNCPVISTLTSSTAVCAGTNISLEVTATSPGGSALSYEWYKNGTAITGATSQTYTATSSGNYKVVKTSGSNNATSNEITVTVNAIPSVPSINRDINNNLVSSFVGTNNWYKDATVIPNETNTIYKPTANGLYTVKAINNGCQSSLSTPYFYVVTDIILLSNDEFINIGPNPFKNNLSLTYYIKSGISLNAKIYEVATGQLVFVRNSLSSNSVLNLSNLLSGTYLIELSSSDSKKCYRFKLLKL